MDERENYNTVNGVKVRRLVEGCFACETYKKSKDQSGPLHYAKTWCQSGMRNHCTCDSCY